MKNIKLQKITRIAMLAAISALLMYFDFPLWFAPNFYKLDFSELPVLIGAFALGPVSGIVIEAVKVFIVFLVKGSSTGGVGEVSNFLIGLSFVLPAAYVYKFNKTKTSAIVGMVTGTVILTAVGGVLNAFVLIPIYSKFIPLEQIIQMANKLNSSINNITTLILFAVVPFNLVKGILVSILTTFIYKRISPILKNERAH